MTDIRQSPFWALFMEEMGWSAIKVGPRGKEQFAYLRKVPLFGSVLKAPRLHSPIPFNQFDDLAIDRKLAFAKIEPNHLSLEKTLLKELRANNYKTERWSLHPTKTIVFDLRKKEDEILAHMEKDTRYSIRAAQRRGVRVIKSKDVERFLKLYKQTAARQKFWVAEKELRLLWEIFLKEGKAFILLAQWNKTDVAGVLVLHYDKKAYYYHAASLGNLGELYAPYLLVWETILTTKGLNLKELDLEGIYDPRIPSTKRWKGFTHFKKGFRGEEVELLGSFAKPFTLPAKIFFKFGNFTL